LNSKLKLLFVSRDTFPPFRVDVKVLFGQELAGRGWLIDWLLQSEAHCERAYQTVWSGGRVWVGKTVMGETRIKRLRKYIHGILHDCKILRLSLLNRYDFIQIKDKFISPLTAILASKLFGSSFLYWLSYPFPESNLYAVKTNTARYPAFYYIRGQLTRFLLYKVIMQKAEHIFVQSEQMKKDIALMGIPEKKMTAVPMGVNLDDIPYHLPDHPEPAKEKIVLYLGTLEKIRRLDFLIRVFEKVLQRHPEAQLHLVGRGNDPSDEDFLREETFKLGIQDSVFFKGFLPMHEAWKLVSQAQVCASPFYPTPILNSTSPTKIVEYMAMGKPVVANDHPEQRLVISESGAGQCVPYTVEAFADAISDLLGNPEKAAEMGRRGRFYVERKRTYKTIADLVETEYLYLFRDRRYTKT